MPEARGIEIRPVRWSIVAEDRLVTSSASVLESALETGAPEALSHASPSPGERSRIEALVAREYVGLRLLIARRTGDPQVAAELLNDAVCTTWEKWQAGQIARPDQIVGYIFQVAMNHWRNRRRIIAERPDKRADAKLLEALPSSEPAADDAIEAHIATRVKELIKSLRSRRDRAVLVRFYLDEEDSETICRELELTPAQFVKVLHRARGRLRELVESSGLKGSDLFSVLAIL